MSIEPFGRLDNSSEIRNKILPYCRLKMGEIWIDPIKGHKVGVLDATKQEDVISIFGSEKATLAVQDPAL